MAISANKVAGIRAANVGSEQSARLSREHNNANVLALGARVVRESDALKIVDVFINTPFAGGRHERGHQRHRPSGADLPEETPDWMRLWLGDRGCPESVAADLVDLALTGKFSASYAMDADCRLEVRRV